MCVNHHSIVGEGSVVIASGCERARIAELRGSSVVESGAAELCARASADFCGLGADKHPTGRATGRASCLTGHTLVLFHLTEDLEGRLDVSAPRFDAFTDGEGCDDERGDGVGPPPSEKAVQNQTDEYGAGEVDTEQ